MSDLLVTGTDTGVGKTVIAAALLLVWRERGIKAIGFKPAASGVVAGEMSDADVLAKAAGRDEPLAQPLLSLAEPLAPAVAAERAGLALSVTALDDRMERLRANGYRIVVEGAGGVLVPLRWGYSVLDLAVAHGLEAVIVGRAGLGTLNHVALTVAALRARGIPVRGVVLNGRGLAATLAEETNPAALARLLPDVKTVVVPRHESADPLEAAYASVPLLAGLMQESQA